MKFGRNFAGAKDSNFGGKIGIESQKKLFGRNPGTGAESGDLAERRDTGIGPAATQNNTRLAGDGTDRVFDFSLNGTRAGLTRLNLPPRKGEPVETDFQFQRSPLFGVFFGTERIFRRRTADYRFFWIHSAI